MWALTLSGYQYKIEYKPSTNLANADALSHLPRTVTTTCTYNGLQGELVQLINHLQTTCITAEEIKCWIEKDPLLSRLCRFVISGWTADNLGKEFQPFVSRQKGIECLKWLSFMGLQSHNPTSRKKILIRPTP